MANEEDLVPELGDFVTIHSDLYKTTTGIIIYRDGAIIRIRPVNSTQTIVDFPLEAETGLFQPSLGVNELLIHTKRLDPHFSKQLGVLPGERLELLDAEGKMIEPTATVFEVIATDEYDAIRLEDGRILDFQFLGPPPPYALLRPRAAPEAEAVAGIEADVEELPDEAFPDIDVALLPAALVEEIPSEERTYSDSIQREDMFVSLLTDHTPERQKDPKIMSKLYRLTDVMLAMKNSLLQRDESGAPLLGAKPFDYTAATVQEALEKQTNGAPLSALIPIAAVKKVLYTDDEDRDMADVVLRNDTISLMNALTAANTFSIDKDEGNPFITYINDLLRATAAYKSVVDGKKLSVDQDVLRSQMPPDQVQGFPTTGAAFTRDRPPAPVPLLANALGTVSKTDARLLGPSKIRNPKTNSTYVVAPADTAEVVGHLLISKELLDWRSPIRTNNLLWDVSNSETSRSKRKTFHLAAGQLWTKGDEESQRSIFPGDTTLLKDELQKRCDSSLQFNTRSIVTVMDSLGLRNLELTEDLLEPISAAIVSGTTVWDAAYKALGAAAIERLKVPSVPVVEAAAPAVWTEAVLKNETFQPVIDAIKQKETTLKDYDLLLANDVYSLAGGTLGPFTSGLLGGIDIAALEATFKNETAREDRNKATSRENAKLLRAAPDINPCIHVKELEKTRSIRDDSKRMIMFDKFLKKFSGGQKGNYISCGNCNKDLVCKHEVLMLNEYLNPGRAVALHKTLLLDFAGPVFEGAYICKTCGQKIMELEYDTHLEFDDEGRPLVGRGVIEVDEEDEFNAALAAESDADIPFKGAQRKLYFQLRALFELCGMALELDVYKRSVASLNSYIDAFVSTEEAYNAAQERAKAAAAKAQKRFTGVPYINFQSTQIIGAVGALAVLELQTNPINVPIAAPGCVLSRSGFPLDGVDPATAGTGALDYVACALASVKRDDVPWNKVFWSAETDTKRRVDQSKNTVLLALSKVLGIQLKGMPAAPVPLDQVTQLYRDLMDAARSRGAAAGTGVTGEALASTGDKLPPAFRPLQRMVIQDTEAIGNVGRFQKNVESGELLPIRKATYDRQHVLNMKLVAEFHGAAAASGVVQENNPCSESVCCTKTLAALELVGNGIGSLQLPEAVVAEAEVLKNAASTVARRDPAVSNTGTHIYVPWSAPQQINVLPTPDESVYYKLFLKNCYSGRKYGSVHELNDLYKCRNCGFAYPPELVYMNVAEITETGKKQETAIEAMMKERERLALAAFSAQGVEINEQKFRELEEAIRNRRLISTVAPVEVTKFFDSLNDIKIMLFGVCNSSAIEDWVIFIEGMNKIIAEKRFGPQRLGPLVDFSRRYDTLLTNFRAVLGADKREQRRIGAALDSLAAITSSGDPHTIIRTLNSQFVVVAQQVATQFKVRNPPLRKWFPSVNRNHAEALKNIWDVFGKVTADTIAAIDDLSDAAKGVATTALLRFAAAFGPILQIWNEDLRPTIGFTPEEYMHALRWTLFTMLSHLTNGNSTFYQGSPSATVTAEAVKAVNEWIVLAATTSGNIIQKYVLSDEEIRSRVNARTEQEKAMFIAKLDKQEQEMRKLDLVKKKLKIGDWAIGGQNLFKYNKNMFEFERSQRAAMGLPEFTEDITGPLPARTEGAEVVEFTAEVHGMEEGVLHRAAQDEDEDAGEDAGRLHFVC